MPSTRIPASSLAPRKTPRQQRSQETVQAILEAAAQVFESHGYAAATTNRIAQRAGVSIGSLYQYFPNKDAVLLALTRQHIAAGSDVLAPHLTRLREGASLDEVLEDVVAGLVALHALAPGLHRVLFEETPLPPTLRSELDELENQLVQTLARALATAENRAGRDCHLRARIVFTAIEGLTHRLVLYPPPGTDTTTIAHEITTLVHAYVHAG